MDRDTPFAIVSMMENLPAAFPALYGLGSARGHAGGGRSDSRHCHCRNLSQVMTHAHMLTRHELLAAEQLNNNLNVRPSIPSFASNHVAPSEPLHLPAQRSSHTPATRDHLLRQPPTSQQHNYHILVVSLGGGEGNDDPRSDALRTPQDRRLTTT